MYSSSRTVRYVEVLRTCNFSLNSKFRLCASVGFPVSVFHVKFVSPVFTICHVFYNKTHLNLFPESYAWHWLFNTVFDIDMGNSQLL